MQLPFQMFVWGVLDFVVCLMQLGIVPISIVISIGDGNQVATTIGVNV